MMHKDSIKSARKINSMDYHSSSYKLQASNYTDNTLLQTCLYNTSLPIHLLFLSQQPLLCNTIGEKFGRQNPSLKLFLFREFHTDLNLPIYTNCLKYITTCTGFIISIKKFSQNSNFKHKFQESLD